MKDYYAILGLKSDCTKNDVRRTYRAKAKEIHPDRIGNEGTARFLALKEAYEVLSSAKTREAYDLTWRSVRHNKDLADWDYRDFLHDRKNDPESLSKLICYDLLHDRDTEAIELHEEALSQGFFSLRSYLDREDFMDYAFLLAEAYLERNAVVKAYRLFKGIAELEEVDPYFRHFYIEVLDRLAAIVRQSLPDDPDNRLRMVFLADLLKLSYSKKDEARLRQLYSELLSAAGYYEAAAAEVFKAHELAPNLPGLAETVKVLQNMDLG